MEDSLMDFSLQKQPFSLYDDFHHDYNNFQSPIKMNYTTSG
jgi:hypothetical protein